MRARNQGMKMKYFVYEKNLSNTCFYKKSFKILKEAREYTKTHKPPLFRCFVISRGKDILDSILKAEKGVKIWQK